MSNEKETKIKKPTKKNETYFFFEQTELEKDNSNGWS